MSITVVVYRRPRIWLVSIFGVLLLVLLIGLAYAEGQDVRCNLSCRYLESACLLCIEQTRTYQATVKRQSFFLMHINLYSLQDKESRMSWYFNLRLSSRR